MNQSPRRKLPPVHEILQRPELAGLERVGGPETLRDAVREAVEEARKLVQNDPGTEVAVDRIAQRAAEILQRKTRPNIRPVLNATGILLHTGLGRAPLAAEAIQRIQQVSAGYCNLEIDLPSGERGKRATLVSTLLTQLTGAEAATVVNNNAAATVLSLRALASGREVVVSRGQLVEIGGSYRLPEVFEASGARLREVGTTNKTHLSDYQNAIGPETAALLRVHTSNFQVVGFTESVSLPDLSRLARSRGVLLIDDIGSGALKPGCPPLRTDEPTIADGLAQGADLVLCSGDKLLGGPQCGLIVGRKEVVERLERDPLMRAFRVDKLTLAALEATLRLMLDPDRARQSIPLWKALAVSPQSLMERASRLSKRIGEELGMNTQAVESTAFLGGGSAPADALPSAAVRLDPPWRSGFGSEDAVHHALRIGDPALVGRVHAGSVWLDLRTVPESDDDRLFRAVASLKTRTNSP